MKRSLSFLLLALGISSVALGRYQGIARADDSSPRFEITPKRALLDGNAHMHLVKPLANSIAAGGDKQGGERSLKAGDYTTELNGLKLWYKVSGSGPVCLMPSPAWGPGSDMAFRTLKPLEKTFTIVYLDSRGTGRSQRAKATTEYTWEHLVADLDALRAHLKQDKVWLMGASEAGMQILHYACKHPDRVSGLVLLAAAAVTDEQYQDDVKARAQRRKDQPWFAEAQRANQAEFTSDEDMKRGMMKMLPMFWSDPSKIAKYQEDYAAGSMSVEAWRGRRDSKRSPFDLTRQLSRVKAPALIVVGDDDFICSPLAAKRLHLGLPNSKLLLIEKCGHFPWLEQPETFFTDVPAFLAALGLGR